MLSAAIRWKNLYPVDSAKHFVYSYPLDSDLSVGKLYPAFERLRSRSFRCYVMYAPSPPPPPPYPNKRL